MHPELRVDDPAAFCDLPCRTPPSFGPLLSIRIRLEQIHAGPEYVDLPPDPKPLLQPLEPYVILRLHHEKLAHIYSVIYQKIYRAQ
jgi:hypothetical protein